MSDVVAESAAPVSTGGDSAPSAPQSTADITANVVRSAESADREESAINESAAEDTTRAAATEVAAEVAPPKPAVAIKDLSIEEQLLHEFGFKDLRRPDGREHYIPRSKVLQMIGSGLKRGEARWEGERTAIEATAKTAQADLHELITDLRGDPKVFLSKVAQHDPRYRAFLEPQAAPQQLQQDVNDPEPEPDVDLGNGQRTFSLDGLRKLRAWERREFKRELDATTLRPIQEREKAEKARAERQQAESAMHGRVSAQMQEAQTWPDFGPLAANGTYNEVQQAVLGLLQKDSEAAKAAGRDPRMTLLEAYQQVRIERLSTERSKVRESVLAELNTAPKSTSVARTGVEHTRTAGPRTTADIARQMAAQLESQQ